MAEKKDGHQLTCLLLPYLAPSEYACFLRSKTSAYPEPKSHYLILDGLHGVAALMVVAFHVFETYSGGNRFV